MYIAQDVVDLIVDQLSQSVPQSQERERHLRAASLVSTVWVNRSQHHLSSTIDFRDSSDILKWCSNIEPDPYGVSSHVRVLLIGSGRAYISPPPVILSDIETALPHLTLFKNLQELALPHIDLKHPSLGVLVPIFSSFAGTLKRLRWAQEDPVHETWEAISTLADHLPNLTYINLSGYDWGRYNHKNDPQCEVQIQLST